MKKFFLTAFLSSCISIAFSQIDTAVQTAPVMPVETVKQPKRDWSKLDLANRSNDHLLIQFGADSWGSVPDSMKSSGFSRHFNIYFMLDKPFRNNPRFSVGLGVGVGTSNMFFDNKLVDLRSSSARLPFTNVDSADHFKKFKLTTAYAEAPVELRYNNNPAKNGSFKMAVGVKVGTMINAHTKGKTLQNKNDQNIGDYTQKISSKKYFNTTRLSLTSRIGYGLFSISGAYQLTNLFKDGVAPEVRPYSIGITISGL